MKLSEFMRGYDSMEIRCAYTGKVVRRLVRIDDTVDLDAITESVGLSVDTLLTKDSWLLDRASICFTYDSRAAKLCTEGDILVFPDGTEVSAEI